MYDIPPSHASQMSKTGSAVAVDISGHVDRWLQKVQFPSIPSCESKWFGLACASRSGCVPEVVVIELSMLDDLDLLFERDAGCTIEVGVARLVLQKE